MKKIVFAAVLACSTVASAQWSMDLPNLWWPEEFTGEASKAEVQMITSSKNVQAYLKKNKLGSIQDVVKTDEGVFVMVEACSFQVVVRKNATPAVRPVSNSLYCD